MAYKQIILFGNEAAYVESKLSRPKGKNFRILYREKDSNKVSSGYSISRTRVTAVHDKYTDCVNGSPQEIQYIGIGFLGRLIDIQKAQKRLERMFNIKLAQNRNICGLMTS